MSAINEPIAYGFSVSSKFLTGLNGDYNDVVAKERRWALLDFDKAYIGMKPVLWVESRIVRENGAEETRGLIFPENEAHSIEQCLSVAEDRLYTNKESFIYVYPYSS